MNLYTIHTENREGDNYSCTVTMNPDSPIYAAHFPGFPVTPGVCIIQMAKEMLERAIDTPVELRTIKNAKFLQVLQPGDTPITVTISKLKRDEAAVAAQTTFTDNADNVYAKISLQAIIT